MKKLKMFISSLLAVMMLMSTSAFGVYAYAADGSIAINSTNFEDINFRTIISEVYDTNGNGFLEDNERNKTIMTLAAYAEEICGEGAVIDNLKGIELFPNLTRLYCAGIGLNSLDISQNTKLTYVTAGGNNLTSITIGNQTNLRTLDVSANDITSLNLSTCPNLVELECNSNALTGLNVSMLSNLQLLYCQQNKISNLNLMNNTQLVFLHCSNNNLWELDLSRNTNLEDITASEIGDQWVSTGAYISAGRVLANHAFLKPANLVSTTVDRVEETEEGTVTTLGFSNGNFYIPDLNLVKERLVDENGEKYDGIVYKYSVGNDGCDYMTVNVKLSRAFYQVDYYLDSTKEVRIATNLVTYGNSVTAPEAPEAPQCKRFVGWSDTATNVTADMDIYAVWADDHVMHWYIDRKYNVSMYCENCVKKTVTFNFLDAYNSKKGQGNYVEKGDMNGDGCINAKDFAIIIHQ